jgi:hypothetical protein
VGDGREYLICRTTKKEDYLPELVFFKYFKKYGLAIESCNFESQLASINNSL